METRATPPEFVRTDAVKTFWTYVQSLCADVWPPRYGDFEVMDLFFIAPHLVILDTPPGSARFLVRYAGTSVVAFFGRETTGLYMDQVDLGEHKDELVQVYRRCRDEARPFWTLASVHLNEERRFGPPVQRMFDYERLVYPFQGDDGSIVRLVSIVIREDAATEETGFECRELPPMAPA
jgi:hypothetical protein